MIDVGILVIAIWLSYSVLVAIDLARHGLSLVFWRLSGLVCGPFALLAYGIARELASKQQDGVTIAKIHRARIMDSNGSCLLEHRKGNASCFLGSSNFYGWVR